MTVQIWRMRLACWITKTTDTQSEYVILIAFPRQQRLRECTSVLCYTYISLSCWFYCGCIGIIPWQNTKERDKEIHVKIWCITLLLSKQILGSYRNINNCKMAPVLLYELNISVLVLYFPWILINEILQEKQPWRETLCLIHPEVSSHRKQHMIKNMFNRKFVTLSKDRQNSTKYLPVLDQLIKSLEQNSASEANSVWAS
jgi:hypothetical protein